MRLISFSLTEQQLLNGTKTVTRRLGWQGLKPGTVLKAVDKVMGLRGRSPRVLGYIEVKDVRRERLDLITRDDLAREGFPALGIGEFVDLFCRHMKCGPTTEVTRIEFEYYQQPAAATSGPEAR